MAVIVEVPDDHLARVAKRLIGRRSGVDVVNIGESGVARSRRRAGFSSDRKILIRDEVPRSASEVFGSLQQGVWAVLPATEASLNSSLRECVDNVRTGSSPLLQSVAGDRGEAGEFIATLQSRALDRERSLKPGSDSPLSMGETQILQRISQGITSRQIADEMGFQLQTVKNKVTMILTKTEARSRTHAVAIALANGWIR